MKVCPVCLSRVDEKDAAVNSRMVYYFGQFYYLMCRQCKGEFLRNPDRYIGRKHQESALTPAGPCERSPG